MSKLTLTQLKKIAPKGNRDILSGVVKYFNKHARNYRVDSYDRVCHFIAQAAHETDHFKVLVEYADGTAYEGRRDLGNTQPGDGPRFKGRGIFMYTGRYNYTQLGPKLGVDLVKNPKLLSDDMELAVLSAFIYWQSRKLNQYADSDDVRAVTKKINGGYNGLNDRKIYLERAKKAFKGVFPEIDIKAVQRKLKELGYVEVGSIDGKKGAKTSGAIVAFKVEQTTLEANDDINEEFLDALKNGEKRTQLEERQNATVSDLRKEGSKTIRGADVQTVGGGIVVGAGALKEAHDSGILDSITGIGSTVETVTDAFSPFQYALNVFSDYWWILLVIVGIIIIWQARGIVQSRLQDHRTGNTNVIGIPKKETLLSRLNPFD